MSLQPQRPRIFVWLTTLWASLRALAQTGWLLLAQASTWLRVQLAGWRRWGPGLQERALVIWAWVREELPRWRTWAPRLSRWSQAKALAAAAWYRIQTPARKALVVLLLLVTILTGPTGAVLIRSDIGQRLFGLPASTNRPSYDPTQSHLHLPPSPPITGKPGTARPPMPHAFAALPREVAADPAGFTFLSTDGRFEADVPAGAVTAQDLAGAAGHQEKLRVTQFAPASGGTAGGSGLISFGSYLVELVDGNGKRVGHGFHKPVDIHLHYAPQETVFNLDHAFVVFNGAHPKTISGLGAASSAPLTLDRVKRTLSTQIPVDPAFARNASTAAPVAAAAQSSSAVFNGAHSKTISGLGLVSSAALIVDHIKQALSTLISIIPAFSRNATLKPLGNATAATAATAATSGTPASWGISFNSTSPVAKFVNPDPFNVDLSSGSLNTAIPLDLPAGPAGHVPPLTLAYNSGGVSEQHNPQGAAGWVGEGWNLSLGAITWSERDYNEQCGTKCSQIWQNQWFLSDAFGTSTELLPPATNTSTYYDDTGNPYCAQGNSAAQPCPIQFHTADESYAKVYAYVGGNNYGNSNGLHTLCFRAYLANGIMEEFGCSLDSAHYDSLQYYVAGLCLGTYNCNSTGYYLPSAYYPDLITYPNGDQIHITYQSDTLKDPGSGAWYPRDTVLGTVEWDSPDCINASQACTVSWHPHYRVQFNASHSVARVTNTPANCNTTPGLRCDDPLDLSASGGLPAPAVNSTFVLNDFAVQTNLSGNGGNYSSGAWNTVRDYQLGYEVTGPKPITDAVTGKQQSVAGYLDLTQIQQVGTDNNTANGSPLTSFGYSDQNQYYEDGTLTPPSAAGCGPWGWNVGGNGNPCDLWAQSYESNNRYLSSADNHLGQTQTISWENARSNTHGVNAGGSNFDPLACDNYPASYPCDEADDQQWSRIIVGEHDSSVQQVTQQGQGGAQTSKTITTPYHYTYQLVSYNSNECADCGQGFYWGDENSNDSLDFYSPHFAGFAQTTVSKPDGSMETHKFYSSEGWGVYDASQFTGTNSSKCTVNVPPYTYCRQSSWWDLQNVGHGREYEADYYDTNGTTLLRKVTNQYQAVCPSPGGATSWNGKQASELGSQSNPVVGCDVQLQESTTAHYDGASADSSAAASTVNYYYDPTFGRPTRTVTTNNGGLTAQYFSDTTLTNLVCTRRDPDVNFSLGVGGWPGCGLASTGFSARWTGKVIPQYNETYTFYTLSDDGVRLWVNGQELVNNWTDHAPVENSGTITLTAGQAYDIKMEYYQNQGGATAALSWSSPSTSKQIVPATALQATSTTSNSSQSVDTYTTYIQNDGLTLPSSQLNNTVQEGAWGGTYLVDAVASKETYDPANNRVGCSYTWYDGAAYATGQQASLTHGNPTQKGTDTACSNYSGSLITKMSYDAYGNPVTSTDANNNTGCTANGVSATSCTTYGTVTLAQPTSAANALNQVTTTGYDTSAAGGFGLWPVSTTDPNNQTTTTTYDVLGRVSTIRLPGQTTGVPSTQLTYTFFPSCSGAQTVCYEVDAATRTDSATQVTQRRFYDGASRLVETRTPAPGGMDTVAYTLYDVSGRAYQTSSPYQVTAYTGAPDLAAYSLPDTSVPNTQTLYDGLDRVTQVQDPVGHKSYSSYSSVCNAAGTNDAACYSQTLGVDANGHQHGVLTDGLGRAIYAQDYTGNSGATYAVYRTTTTTYDTLGRQVAMLHPDGTHSTTFTYDTAGRLTAMSDPDRGNESYSYDPNGNLTQTVDARGASGTIYTGYDSLNRQLWRNTTNRASGAYASYSYDSTANGNVGVGRLTGESFTGGLGASLNGSYAYTYDSLGRLTQQTQTTGNVVNCPAGWTCQGINNPTVGMNQFYSSAGVWTVQASGHGIGGTGDTFQYDYQSLPADGALSAQVTSGTVTNAYAKSGLMMRATTDTGSPYYFVLVRAQGTLEVQYRATVGGATTNLATISNVKAPIYLQITRSGTTFSAASSSDGVNWTTIAGSTVTIGAMTGTLLEGLAATANDTNRLGAFTFAHVSLSTTAPASSTYTTSNTYNDASQP
ncbi:MAG TPA: PA14 domain-containing protein, partial [Chloroflexota bacterium]